MHLCTYISETTIWRDFGAGTLNSAYAVFIINRELCLHQENMYYSPLHSLLYCLRVFTGVNS